MIDKIKKLFNSIIKDRKKLIILICGLIIFVVGVIVILFILFGGDKNFISALKNPDGEKIKSEYEELNGVVTEDGKEYPEVSIPISNSFKYISIEEILDIFNNNGDAVIYFGYSSCVYCRNAIQVLVDTAKDTEIDVMYYLDVEKKGNKYDELLKKLGDTFVVTEGKNKEVYSPLVIFVTNGEIVSYNKGTLFSQEDPFQELDESQVQGLSEIYRYGINDVVTSKKLKNNGVVSNNKNS